MEVPATFVPEVWGKLKVAVVISRVLEKPVAETLTPEAVRVAARVVITGTAGGIWIVIVGAGSGVTSIPETLRCTVSVITPVTVPVWTETPAGSLNTAKVWLKLAGKVKFTERPPVENCTAGSSPLGTAGAKSRFSVPVISAVGYGTASSSTTLLVCWAEGTLPGIP